MNKYSIRIILPLLFFAITSSIAQPNYDYSKLKPESLSRGVVAIRETPSEVIILWRYLSSDPIETAFNVYRNGVKLTEKPISVSTMFRDNYDNKQPACYEVCPVLNGKETNNINGSYILPQDAPLGYIEIPLRKPDDGITPIGDTYTYTPNDASIGDVDGDGEYEIILKWDPSNSHDNSHDGYTGSVYIDCYRLTGDFLWRIDLGKNMRAGSHYNPFMVYDLDGDGKDLTQHWVFDTNDKEWEEYAAQGNHNLRVGDVDGDGCDEIIYGSCAIDHDGRGLYTTGLGHGDAIQMTHIDPSQKGLQIWACHENKIDGSTYRDAATGEIFFQVKSGRDIGRCMAADIDPTHPGVEMWSLNSGGIRNTKGEVIAPAIRHFPTNMAVWWDGDLLRELLSDTVVGKYDWENKKYIPLVKFEDCEVNNGSKSTPCLQGDIIGDWREEILFRTKDNTALRLYVSTIDTEYRFHTFLEDPVYRISIATQNIGYNQPTQPGFYFGPDLKGEFRGYVFFF